MSAPQRAARVVAATLLASELAVALHPDVGAKQAASFGTVEGVWTYGAPGPASPGFVRPVNGSYQVVDCFPGVRAWNAAARVEDYIWTVDAAAMVTGAVGYEHSMMSTLELDISQPDVRDIRFLETACATKTQHTPAAVPEPTLHMKTTYSRNSRMKGGFYANVSDAAGVQSYFFDQGFVRERAKAFGWRLVNSAYHDGNILDGGPQVSHLMQNPDSLECLITFQGSESIQDWISNAMIVKAHFCGFADEDESCGLTEKCTMRKAGGAFVHKGFRDHFRRMVGDPTWQERVRPLLPSCAKVHVGGHSLGGAMSELLAACASRAPEAGSYGFEDFDLISWVPTQPQRLSYI